MRSHLGRAAVAAAIVLLTTSSQATEPLRDRREFAAAISKVNEGMSAGDVLKLLGKPDDVVTRHDVGWRESGSTLEIWRYGTAGHLRPATLGQISISEKHLVERIIGKGTPGPTAGLSEAQLRQFIEAIADVDTVVEGDWFNPRPLIRAVNLLQPVGKDAALAALEEFLRLTPHRFLGGDGAMIVMRVLFDVPVQPTVFPRDSIPGEPGCMPPIFEYGWPENGKALPRFPIAIEGDIPFLVGHLADSDRLISMNAIPDADQHLAYFRKYGAIRSEKLVPSDTPFEVLDSIDSPRWTKPANRRWSQRSVFVATMGCGALVFLLFSGWWLARGRSFGLRRAGVIGAFVILCGLMALIRIIGLDRDQATVDPEQIQTAADVDWAERSKKRLKDQAVRLIDTVFCTYSDCGRLDYYGDPTNIKIRWDSGRNMYTYPDGSMLPDPVRYRRHTWRPFENHKFEFIVERNTPTFISASVPYCGSLDPEVRSATLRVFNVKSRDKSMFVLHPDFDSGQGAKLDEGEEIQAEATLGGKKQLSPVFKP
jgi:hypothetical protein